LFEDTVHRSGCKIISQMPGDSYPAGFFRMLILAMTSLCCYDIPSIGLDYFNNLTDFQDATSSSLDISWMYLLIRFLCQAHTHAPASARSCSAQLSNGLRRPAQGWAVTRRVASPRVPEGWGPGQ